MEYLFLGGPLNGTFRRVPACTGYYYMPPAPHVTLANANQPVDEKQSAALLYNRFRLTYRTPRRRPGWSERVVFAHCSTHEEAADLLDRWHDAQGLKPYL